MKTSSNKRGKVWLIPVLSAVLIYILLNREPAADSVANDRSGDGVSARRSRSLTSHPHRLRAKETAFTLENVLAHNPFRTKRLGVQEAVPISHPAHDAHRQPAPARPPIRLDDFEVSAVSFGPGNATAVVNGRLLQVGDDIGNGYRVIGIDVDGVLIESTR